jgi:uncharacterized protein
LLFPLSAGLKLVVYLIGTVALGAALAPWLYWAGLTLSHYEAFGFLANNDFERFFNRSVLISALVLLIPFLRAIGIEQFHKLGLRRNPRRVNHLAGGFLIAACTLGALGGCFVGLKVFELKNPVPWNLLPPILLSAIVVALIEEALFRGAILGIVRQTFPNGFAAIFVSALFSVVHFLSPPREQIAAVHWYSGFVLLPHAFWRFSDPWAVLGGFFTLGILGLILAHSTIRTSSLWLGIGIHSGLIFAKMGFNKLSKKLQDLSPWFSGDITVGIGSILVMLFLWLVIWVIYLRGESDPDLA